MGYIGYFIKLEKILFESVVLFSHLVYLAYCLFKRSREVGDSLEWCELKAVEIESTEKIRLKQLTVAKKKK